MHDSCHHPILIVGGVAAALAVPRSGQRCLLTEPTDWIGGQLAARCINHQQTPHQPRRTRVHHLPAFRQHLVEAVFTLNWPWDR